MQNIDKDTSNKGLHGQEFPVTKEQATGSKLRREQMGCSYYRQGESGGQGKRSQMSEPPPSTLTQGGLPCYELLMANSGPR